MGERSRHIAGLVFVACMFIGAGIGLIFGRPDVGGAIGMGVGFLMMVILRGKEIGRVEMSIPRTIPSIALVVIGTLIIVAGLALILAPELLYPYIAGVITIAVEILIVLAGIISIKRT